MQKNKISQELLTMATVFSKNENEVDVIIFAKNIAAAEFYLNKLSASDITVFNFISAVSAKIKAEQLNIIARNSNITKITHVSNVFCTTKKALQTTNINALHSSGLSGNGVTVAVIDTGISPHFDLVFPMNRIKHFENLVSNKKRAFDDNGHGTFVSGILCGNGLLSGGIHKGVAYKSDIVMVKAMDEKGETNAINILKAMEWVHKNAKKFNIKVCCMSFGSLPTENGDPLALGAEMLWQSGVVVVAAAGNSGPLQETIKSPGISRRIITVGALDDGGDEEDKKDFSVADFSSRGPAMGYFKPDVLAPGVNVYSINAKLNAPYSKMSGTSMAAPIVAGLAALMLEAMPKLRPDEIKALILKSGRKIVFNKNHEGAGLVNAKICIY